MKTQELRTKTDDELKTVVMDSKKELFNLRFQQANGQLEKAHRINVVRKQAAKALTLLSERRLGLKKDAKASAKPKAEKASKPKAKKSAE